MQGETINICICEGAAERAIIERLLEWDCLIFTKEQLMDRAILDKRYRNAKNLENEYLNKYFGEYKIRIYRILDSKKEASCFRLSRKFQDNVEIVNAITSPEIEMLVIIAEGKYDEYTNKYGGGRNKLLPNEYLKQKLGFSNVKSYEFVYSYFKDKVTLLETLKKYSRGKTNSIYDLLKL